MLTADAQSSKQACKPAAHVGGKKLINDHFETLYKQNTANHTKNTPQGTHESHLI